MEENKATCCAAEARKRSDLITLIAAYHFAEAVLFFLAICALSVGLFAVVTTAYEQDAVIGALVLTFVLLVVGLIFLANIVVGWGLLRLYEWARWAAIVLSILRLIAFPVGTIIGALVIWYLLTPAGKEAFRA